MDLFSQLILLSLIIRMKFNDNTVYTVLYVMYYIYIYIYIYIYVYIYIYIGNTTQYNKYNGEKIFNYNNVK